MSNGGETITIIKNGAQKTYWVWGRPKINSFSLSSIPEEPKMQKLQEDKLEPQPIGPYINKYAF